MTDALGKRAVFSVVLPASNSIAEPDMALLRPPGVSNQTFRFSLAGRPDKVEALLELMGPTVALALDCRPDQAFVAVFDRFVQLRNSGRTKTLYHFLFYRRKYPVLWCLEGNFQYSFTFSAVHG